MNKLAKSEEIQKQMWMKLHRRWYRVMMRGIDSFRKDALKTLEMIRKEAESQLDNRSK